MADKSKSSSSRLDARLGQSTPLVPPLFQSSVYTLPDLDALDRILDGNEPGFIYARDAHPNARQLAGELAGLEAASWAFVCGSGMAAITAALLSLVDAGDHVAASNRLYGRTTQLLDKEFTRFGVHTTFVDVSDPEQIREAFRARPKVLFLETISNPMLRLADLEMLGKLARSHDCSLVVDNTFATPALIKPLECGAAIVVESLTKMLGGHSDVTLGVLAGNSDLASRIAQIISIWGLSSNPFDCWLALRGLETFPLRMKIASENTAALAEWLPGQKNVVHVIYPGRPDHPDHELARRLLPERFGNMLCFELAGGREAVNRFMRRAKNIPFSPSLGHTATTCSHPGTTSHRYVSPEEKKAQGISDGLLRLSVGIENLSQIQKEIAKGLS